MKQNLINKIRVDAYEKAINKIDDYFEYANDSEKDKQMVRDILEDLSSELEYKMNYLNGDKND